MKKIAVDFLTPHEKLIVIDCLKAAADGPFFPDWEFGTLIGVSREEVRATAQRLQNKVTFDEDGAIITNVLNNLIGYPHNEFERWHTHFDVPKKQIAAILKKLLNHK